MAAEGSDTGCHGRGEGERGALSTHPLGPHCLADTPRTTSIKINLEKVSCGCNAINPLLLLCCGFLHVLTDHLEAGCLFLLVDILIGNGSVAAFFILAKLFSFVSWWGLQVASISIEECISGYRSALTGVNNRSGYRGVRRVSLVPSRTELPLLPGADNGSFKKFTQDKTSLQAFHKTNIQ